jgi:hypothetical protein
MGAAGLQRSMTIVMLLSDKLPHFIKKIHNFTIFSKKKSFYPESL